MNHKIILLAILLCWLVQPNFAQNTSRWAVNMQFFHQDYAIDLDPGQLGVTDATALRPGVSAGIERTWRNIGNDRIRLFQDLNVGFWNSPYSENYSFVGTRLAADFRIFKQLRLTTGALYRIGRAKTKDVRYIYENEKWIPAKNSTPGFLRQNVGFDTRLGWRFAPNSAHPIDIQFGINWTLAWKFAPAQINANLMPYKAFQVGLRYSL